MISITKVAEVQPILSNLKRIGNWTTEKHARAALELSTSSTQAHVLPRVVEVSMTTVAVKHLTIQ
jgi:hypothetical protein